MDKYEIKDEKGRIEFTKYCNYNTDYKIIKFATQKYSSWDVALTHNNNNVVGEIKSRNITSTSYPDFMMEVDKFKAITSIAKEKDIKAYYINNFTDGETYIWDVTNMRLESFKITKQLLPKNDFDDTLVWKDVFFLLRNQRINITSPNNNSVVFEDDEDEDDENELPF